MSEPLNGDSDSDDSVSAPPSPRIRDEEEEETGVSHAGIGGLGFNRATAKDDAQSSASVSHGSSRLPEESSSSRPAGGGRPMIGARPGIGAKNDAAKQVPNFAQRDEGPSRVANDDTPTPSSRAQTAELTPEPDRPRSLFTGRQPAPTTFARPTPLSAQEAAHFRSIQGSIGSKLLSKFGWSAGEGLGKDRSGRAVPVEVGKVLRGKGITSGIRTEDSKREARRRGEIVSDSEEEQPVKRGQRKPVKDKKEPDQSWRKQKKVKVKVEHKTYEQLVEEAGDSTGAGIGLVIDARGGEVRL